jgi:hypothetical protein
VVGAFPDGESALNKAPSRMCEKYWTPPSTAVFANLSQSKLPVLRLHGLALPVAGVDQAWWTTEPRSGVILP